MGLTGGIFLAVVVGTVVVLPVLTVVLWNRLRGPRAIRLAARLSLITLCQGTAVLLAALLINNSFQLYASWSDLFGQDGSPGQIDAARPVQLPPVGTSARGITSPTVRTYPNMALFHQFGPAGYGYTTTITGPESKITSTVFVRLPPQYREPQYSHALFPVVQLLSGYPGTPSTWLDAMGAPGTLDGLIEHGAAHPFILVSAAINVDPPHDPDCSNIPGGPQVATWLTTDVRNLIETSFRTSANRDGWGLMGYSEGGLCASKLALQYPGDYSAAVSMSGDDHPDGDLLSPGTAAWNENSPLWLLEHQSPAEPVALLLTGTLQDGATAAEADAMGGAAHGQVTVDKLIAPRGGHNMGVWEAVEPVAFEWLSEHLVSPRTTSVAAAPEFLNSVR
jgi:pimeloyl-ACP methyl ester carboxylesterase